MIQKDKNDLFIDDTRYSRQISLPGIGRAGQFLLSQKRVLVIGAGGLGSPLLFALAGAGIGHITIVDSDTVSESNLNRQFLYRAADIGQQKARLASERLLEYHPDLSVDPVCELLSDVNAPGLIQTHDLVIAAVDNRQTRILINKYCCIFRKVFVDGGVRAFSGYAAVIEPGRTPCYHCLFGIDEKSRIKDPPGVLGSIAGTIGSLEATLAVIMLLGLKNPLDGEIMYFHAGNMSFDRLKIERDPKCPHCSALWKQPSGAAGAREKEPESVK